MIRYTQDIVRSVADLAEDTTRGRFRLGRISRPNASETVYADGINLMSWCGNLAGREATAYYAGALTVWHELEETPIPPLVATIRVELEEHKISRIRTAFACGRSDARQRHAQV